MINIVEPGIEILNAPDTYNAYQILAIAAANCYQRKPSSNEDLVRKIVKKGHHSVLEHIQATFSVTCDRAVSHEWVRHRIGVAYSQESQRYVSYKNDLDVIKPYWWDYAHEQMRDAFIASCSNAHMYYGILRSEGLPPEAARGVLPNATATRIVVSMNLRSIIHFIELRGSEKAHPDIRFLAKELKRIFSEKYPAIFINLGE